MAMANVKDVQFILHLPNTQTENSYEPISDNNLSLEATHTEFPVEELPISDSSPLEESGRGCRAKRRLVPLCCPVCSVTVRPNELEQHYISELNKLDKISSNGKRKLSGCSTMSLSPSATTNSAATSETPDPIPPEKCWETYQNVKSNRQSRLKIKSRKRKSDDVPTCPVCNNQINGDINLHVEECLRRSEGCDSSSEENDEDIDVGGDDFGEYEWAGQHRVRASSMLEGGYSAAGIGTCVTKVKNDEEEDLIVDGDDNEKYGPAQYSERDILLLVSRNEDKEQTALRLAIIGAESPIEDKESDESNGNEEEDVEDNPVVSPNPTIEALKQRVRELESRENNKGQYKCLICMGRYRTPVISICCWHVHCELCWLKTLGIKKLCPQCNMITSPADLRKVYI